MKIKAITPVPKRKTEGVADSRGEQMPLHLKEESQDLCTPGPGLLGLTTAAPSGCDKIPEMRQKYSNNICPTGSQEGISAKVNKESKQPASCDWTATEASASPGPGIKQKQENAEAQ